MVNGYLPAYLSVLSCLFTCLSFLKGVPVCQIACLSSECFRSLTAVFHGSLTVGGESEELKSRKSLSVFRKWLLGKTLFLLSHHLIISASLLSLSLWPICSQPSVLLYCLTFFSLLFVFTFLFTLLLLYLTSAFNLQLLSWTFAPLFLYCLISSHLILVSAQSLWSFFYPSFLLSLFIATYFFIALPCPSCMNPISLPFSPTPPLVSSLQSPLSWLPLTFEGEWGFTQLTKGEAMMSQQTWYTSICSGLKIHTTGHTQSAAALSICFHLHALLRWPSFYTTGARMHAGLHAAGPQLISLDVFRY